MYVSDILNRLLYGAEPIRRLVRRHCLSLIDTLPPELKEALRPIAEYFGGKCMGYPPIWFISETLELDTDQIEPLVSNAHTSICMSLSTSIADDLLDHEKNMAGDALMFFYLLIFEALRSETWHVDGLGGYVYSQAVRTMPLFTTEQTRDLMRKGAEESALRRRAEHNGSRIGNFHRMIAYDLLRQIPGVHEPSQLIELVGDFGEWCSDLDDVADLEQDVLKDEPGPAVSLAVLQFDPTLRNALMNRDVGTLLVRLDHPEFVDLLSRHLVVRIRSVAAGLRRWGSERFAARLDCIGDAIPQEVRAIRKFAQEEYAALQVRP